MNAKEDDNKDISSNRKEPSHTNINDDPTNAKVCTNSYKESDRLPRQKGFVKANLITVITALVTVTLAFLLQIPIELTLTIWLSAFVIDAMYTYRNKRLIGYELNYLIRYSRTRYNNLLFGFLLVFTIEVILLLILSTAMNILADNLSGTFAVFCIFFATLHISAFIRSYKFVNRINK